MTTSGRFRYAVVGFVGAKPSSARSFLLRGSIFLTLLLLTLPPGLAREVAYGGDCEPRNLKASLRSMLWIWNRSWMPLKCPLGTFFDIGWVLSEESCETLRRRGFVSRDPLRRQCDLAQLRLASIRAGVEAEDPAKWQAADVEIVARVNAVLTESHRWASGAEYVSDRPQPKPAVGKNASRGFDKASAEAALREFDQICAKISQPYFLVSGTFLGAVRDGAFIGHDHDIDLGVFEDNLDEHLLPTLRASDDFTVAQVEYICLRRAESGSVEYRLMEKPAIIRVFHRDGVAIDVFVHFYDGDMAWHGSGTHRWNNRCFQLSDYPFLGQTFKGAQDFERYLSENYGPDWRAPKSDFDTNLDTPNMSFVGSANALVFYAWMLARAVKEKQPLRVRKYIDLLRSLGVVEERGGNLAVR